jgi:hypothetical protein
MRDPMCDLNGIANKVRQQRIRHVLVTASDPYGQNSAVVIGSSKG